MILLLDTSTAVCRLTFIDDDQRFETEWHADRQLAKGLLRYIHEQLTEHGWSWTDITGIGVLRGPGSFTGLRIGLTVMNTLADSRGVPIVGASGEDWQVEATGRLNRGENDQIVLPEYGAEAHVTKPRK